MSRKNIAAGNWKMNTTLEEGMQLARTIVNELNMSDSADVILGVPATHLKSLRDMTLHIDRIHIAAQNCHHEDSGAFTGEISVDMLDGLSISHCIIGHSERRTLFNETNEQIAMKASKLINKGITAIFCCGESLETRQEGNHVEYVSGQIKDSLFQLSQSEILNVIIAYEPIWAIGTGETASADQAQEMHKAIREVIAGKFGKDVADSMSILYGGSVKPANAKELFSEHDIDGGLVGGASLKSDSFMKIINAF